MNIITIIQTALDALNNTADLFLLEKSRAENEELENTKDTIIVFPDDISNNDFTQGLEINTSTVYNIDFKTPDEWDNSDDNLPTAYESKTSAERIDDMETLADSVFYYISNNNNLFPEIKEKLKWTSPKPILRANNGTMSGASVQLTVVFSGDVICDYTPEPLPTLLYSNGVVSNAVEGEFAFFDFDVTANFSGDMTFAVNWGAQIGTTFINATLVDGVSQHLQTTIEIPAGVDTSQTVNTTDTLGGSYAVGYTVDSSSYPAVIDDGNSEGWYIADELSTITKDGSDFMSEWRDFLGSGHDLLQALGSSQPLWELNDGVLLDGIDNFMRAVFSYSQPEYIYIVFKQITWSSGRRIFDGILLNTGGLFQTGSTPGMKIYAGGAALSGGANLDLDTFGIIRAFFNSSSSKLQVNEGTPQGGNIGTNSMQGFTIGGGGGGSINASHIQVKEILLRSIADTPTNEQAIYDYLANKYSI